METNAHQPSFKNMFKTMDLTIGSPWKALLYFAIPILISSAIGNAFSLVNALILKSTVGGDATTAMSITGSISALLFNFAYGASSGFSVIASNARGAHDLKTMRVSFVGSLFLSLIIGIVLMSVGLSCLPLMLNALHAGAYYQRAYNYFFIILLSFPLMLLSNLLGNYLQAIGNSFAPLVIGLIGTAVNIFLAFAFTAWIKLDTAGVAYATLGAHAVNVFLAGTFLYLRYPQLRTQKEDYKVPAKMYWDLLKMGIPLGFQWSILFIGSFIQQSKVNLFGVDSQTGLSMAAKAVACYSSFEGYLTIPLSAIATSLMAFVGQNYGAKHLNRIKEGAKDALILDGSFYLLILVAGLVSAPYVPYIFLPEKEVNERILYYCVTYLRVLTPCLIFQGVLQLSRSCLQGIKKPLIPFLSGIGELLARAFVCLCVPGWVDPANPTSDKAYLSICFSNPSAWLMSVLIMGGSVLFLIFLNKNFRDPEVSSVGEIGANQTK